MTKILNNKILRYVLLIVFSGLILSSVILGITSYDESFGAFAEEPEVVSTEIDDVYAKYSSVTFPTETTVSYGTQTNLVGTFAGLRLPNGSIYSGNTYEFVSNGKYSAVYTFNYNNKKLMAEKEFTVQSKLYEDFIGSSTVSYGELESTGSNGLIVNLADGDTFKFGHAINLHDTDIANIITFSPRQLVQHYKVQNGIFDQGAIDCNYIYVTLTDVYDSSKTVELQLRFTAAKNMSRNFTGAVLSEHGHVAFDEHVPSLSSSWITYKQITINGKTYFIWDQSGLNDAPHRGSQVQDLTGGRYGNSNGYSANTPISWEYKADGMEVYCSNYAKKMLIDDLDNADVATATGIFEGFTTGEVYVSVSGFGYLAPSTTIEISSIGNYSGADLAELYAVDDIAPSIDVDVDMQGATSLTGVVYEGFKVFDAVAHDPNLVGEVRPLVYYNYGTPAQTLVGVENGYFTPVYPGQYSIVYTATDTFGNVANEVIPVSIIVPASGTNGGRGIDASYEKVGSFAVGNEVAIETPAFKSYNGAVNCKKIVIAPDGTEKDISKSGSFVATMVGNYTIKYEYSDNVYTYVSSYTVASANSTDAFFNGEPFFLKYYIKYATYKIDDFFAYYMQNGSLKSTVATLMVKYDDGDFVQTDINNVTIAGNETVTFKFVYESLETAEYTAKIIDAKFKQVHENSGASLYDVSKYFYGNFDTVLNGQGQRLTSNVESGTNGFEFINPLPTAGFSLKFYIPTSMSNFETLRITLTDIYDETNQTVLTMYEQSYHTYFRVNDYGAKDVTTIQSNVITKDTIKMISFNASKSLFVFNDQTTDTNVSFNGVLPDMVYLKIELVNISGVAAIDVYSINSQLFNVTRDNGKPVYNYVSASGYYNYGSVVTISKATVSDVLSPVSIKDVTITVKAGTTVVTSEDGILLNNVPATRDYKVSLTSDRYTVIYNGLVDGYGNKISQQYVMDVVDFEKPIITFVDGANEETIVKVSVGSEVEMKQFTITDNKTDADKIRFVVVIVNGFENDEAHVTSTMKYTFFRPGMYKCKVVALDEVGNMGIAYYNFQVS